MLDGVGFDRLLRHGRVSAGKRTRATWFGVENAALLERRSVDACSSRLLDDVPPLPAEDQVLLLRS